MGGIFYRTFVSGWFTVKFLHKIFVVVYLTRHCKYFDDDFYEAGWIVTIEYLWCHSVYLLVLCSALWKQSSMTNVAVWRGNNFAQCRASEYELATSAGLMTPRPPRLSTCV